METSPVTDYVEEEEEEEEVGRARRERKRQGWQGTPGERGTRGAYGRGFTKMLTLGRTLRGKGVPGGKPKLNGPDGAHRRSRSNPILRGEKEKMPVC